MRTIRASEIGTYLYCQRAWWYSKNGQPSANQAELAGGKALHHQHGRAILAAGCLRILAYGLALAALVLVALHFTGQLF